MRTVGDIYRLAELALIEVAVHGDQSKCIIIANEADKFLKLTADANGLAEANYGELPLHAAVPDYANKQSFIELIRRYAPSVKVEE